MPKGRYKIFDRAMKIHMTERMIGNLGKMAAEEETSISEITRRAVRFYLQSKKYF